MGIRRWILPWVWLFCLAAYGNAEGEPGRFAISQVAFQAPALTAYLDVLDQNGQPPARLDPAELAATIGGQELKVVSVTPFDTSGEGVAYIFLVDVSKSIDRAQFQKIRNVIVNWIDGLNANDRMAIFAFGEQDRQLIDFTGDKARLKAALANVQPTDMQTKLYLALKNAIDLRRRTDAALPNRRVIVVLSDGKDEGSGFTAGDIRNLVQQSPMPIYAIGSSRLPLKERAQYLEALNRIASLSGGLYVESTTLPAAYSEIKRAIRRVFVALISCGACQISAQAQPLDMTLKTGTVGRTDRLAVSLIVTPPPAPAVEEPWWQQFLKQISWKVTLSVGLVLTITIVVVIVVVVKRPKPPETPPGPVVAPPPAPEPTPAPAPPGCPMQLTVVSGTEHGRVNKLNLSGKATVGRDPKCDVSYPGDQEMSAQHYQLILAGAHVEIVDLGSRNGTLLNGARLVTQQRLEDGDLVRAGRTEVRVNFGD